MAEAVTDQINSIRDDLADIRAAVVVLANSLTLSTDEAAKYLSCSEATIRTMVKDERLVALSAGTSLRFRKCDLDALHVPTVRAKARRILKRLEAR